MPICWTEDGFNMDPPEQPTLSEIKTEKETRKVLILQVGLISVVILLEDVDTVIG